MYINSFLRNTLKIIIMPEMEMKRRGDEYSVVPAKKTRHEISVVGTREKAVVTSTVRYLIFIGKLSQILKQTKTAKFEILSLFEPSRNLRSVKPE